MQKLHDIQKVFQNDDFAFEFEQRSRYSAIRDTLFINTERRKLDLSKAGLADPRLRFAFVMWVLQFIYETGLDISSSCKWEDIMDAMDVFYANYMPATSIDEEIQKNCITQTDYRKEDLAYIVVVEILGNGGFAYSPFPEGIEPVKKIDSDKNTIHLIKEEYDADTKTSSFRLTTEGNEMMIRGYQIFDFLTDDITAILLLQQIQHQDYRRVEEILKTAENSLFIQERKAEDLKGTIEVKKRKPQEIRKLKAEFKDNIKVRNEVLATYSNCTDLISAQCQELKDYTINSPQDEEIIEKMNLLLNLTKRIDNLKKRLQGLISVYSEFNQKLFEVGVIPIRFEDPSYVSYNDTIFEPFIRGVLDQDYLFEFFNTMLLRPKEDSAFRHLTPEFILEYRKKDDEDIELETEEVILEEFEDEKTKNISLYRETIYKGYSELFECFFELLDKQNKVQCSEIFNRFVSVAQSKEISFDIIQNAISKFVVWATPHKLTECFGNTTESESSAVVMVEEEEEFVHALKTACSKKDYYRKILETVNVHNLNTEDVLTVEVDNFIANIYFTNLRFIKEEN